MEGPVCSGPELTSAPVLLNSLEFSAKHQQVSTGYYIDRVSSKGGGGGGGHASPLTPQLSPLKVELLPLNIKQRNDTVNAHAHGL